ncbi:MAG: hypothetical protein RIQ33_2329 [Bacteroidota bacterium]|jgi:hypothetical protein
MVIVKIFVEGGIVPHLNNNVMTVNNSERLREAFKKLFSKAKAIDENKFKIEVELVGGFEKTIERFKNNFTANSLLLIDLDDSENNKIKRISFYELNGYEDSTFFMVQKMEGWILSQLDKVDFVFKERKTTETNLNSYLKNRRPKDIENPEVLLDTILIQNFKRRKNDESRLRYNNGKLKLAPQLLEVLEIEKLKNDFEDVANLIEKINQSNNN